MIREQKRLYSDRGEHLGVSQPRWGEPDDQLEKCKQVLCLDTFYLAFGTVGQQLYLLELLLVSFFENN